MEPELLDAILRRVNERIEALSDHITSNRCESVEDYRFSAGGIKELREILEGHKELEKKFLED